MSNKIFLPESLYELDSNMSLEKLQQSFEDDEPVTAKVTRYNSYRKCLEVDLGNNMKGVIPLSDSTIYPIYKKGLNNVDYNITPHIYTLIGKRIRAKITSCTETIQLSRKEHMLEAIKYLKCLSEIPETVIVSFSKNSAFMDIGAGIMGRIYCKDFSHSFIFDMNHTDFQVGDILKQVKVLSFDSELNRFDLSRLACLPPYKEVLHAGDIVTCKVINPLNDPVGDPEGVGYFVEIATYISGILDSPIELLYTDEVSAVVSKVTSKGPRLKLVEKLN